MSKADLKMPGTTAEVDVVYRAPRMICTSRHAIKAFADKYVKRISHRYTAGSAFAVFISVLPVVTTEQKFTGFLFLSGDDMPGLYRAIACLSGVICVWHGIKAFQESKKANSDYMLQELLADGDSSEANSNVSLDTAPARFWGFKSFANKGQQPN